MQINRQLLAAISEGDEKVIFQLYRYCHDQLHSLCRRYVNSEDEVGSILNMGFLKIVKNIKNYQPQVPFEAWIRRIMINTAIDQYRKNKKYRETISYPEELTNHANGQESINYNEADLQFDAEQLLQLIQKLPPVSKAVFNLYAMDGYSHKEIGKMLNISEGTSKWHLSNARKRLQDLLAKGMKKKLIGTVNSGTVNR